jgi:hypothetical protein
MGEIIRAGKHAYTLKALPAAGTRNEKAGI